VTVRALGDGDDALVDRLIALYPFKPYREYRVWSRARQRAILRAEIDRARAGPGHVGLLAGEADQAVMALCRPLPWDSAFFGLAMARLDLLLRGAETPRLALDAVLSALLQECRSRGVRHITARVDVADMQAVAALEDAGFRLMDALVTYYTHPRREPPPPVREMGQIRPFVESDLDQVLAITEEAYRGFRGRFQLDPHLPPDRGDAFYMEWARQCCAGRMADRLVVADDGQGELHGWASTRRVEPASSVGRLTLWAGSLGACRRDRPGAYAGLIRALAFENYEAGEVTETQTQNHNVPTVRIYNAVGAQYVRADYTFHAWLG
jgi:L-amino acid N-acyltransferase YncA